jgi:FtsP/CotA-like multicopper oxidase with cupredoxin domain
MLTWKQKLAETARKNRVEIVDAKLTRRDLFKMGLLTSGGFLVAKTGLSSRAAGAADTVVSPPTTPWVEPLPIPQVTAPMKCSDLDIMPTCDVQSGLGEMGRVSHEHWGLIDLEDVDVYVNTNAPAAYSWHRELPADDCWAFNGQFPGPRIHAKTGKPVIIRWKYDLPSVAEHRGYGRPTPTIHLHNGHVASDSDGNPLDMIDKGCW